MPYLNVDLAYFTHRKTIRLVGLLGRGAEVLPIKLWSYCGMHHAESGRLASYGPEEIETVAGWWGEKGRAVEAMLLVGFLERDSDGNFQVHDWLEHAGHLAAFKKRAISAAKKRWKRYATSITTSNARDGPKQSPSRGKARNSKASFEFNGEESPREGGLVLPDWLPPKEWAEFKAHRKRKKAPVTDSIGERLIGVLRDLKELGYDPAAVLTEAVDRNWTGIKVEWIHKPGGGNGKEQHPAEPKGFAGLRGFLVARGK